MLVDILSNPSAMPPALLAQATNGGNGEAVLVAVVVGLLGLLLGIGAGFILHRMLTGSTLAKAHAEADRIVENAELKANTETKERELAMEKDHAQRRASLEEELNASRTENREFEKRLNKRESSLDKREASAERDRDRLDQDRAALDQERGSVRARESELETIMGEQRSKLLELAGINADQAKAEVLQRIEAENREEAARIIRRVSEDLEAESREKAVEVLSMAVQRYAAESTSESTVRSVEIPSDDMKGRIIGREGRNIRAIERATGADIIVDDTPGVIVVSCFDKIRQTIAVEALQRLIKDGRMHPTRIEEIVGKVREEVGERVKKAGKDAALEVQLRGMHPKIVEAMGKLHFRSSHGQNVLRHSIEVAYFSQIIADQIGLDGQVARRCGFLHDIGKAMDHEQEGTHPAIGMTFAKQHGESEPVLNAIGGHHGDIPATSFYTPVIMAADAISSARPGARRESMERYIQRLNELQDIAKAEEGVDEAYAVQAGREVRVMVDAKRVSDDRAHQIASDIASRVSQEMTFPGEIRVTVLRETRAIEYAR
ncbi:MAG: ribonuclease Y [Planctomycetota bacterium]